MKRKFDGKEYELTTFALEGLEESLLVDGTEGYCVVCGDQQNGVEPDAREYHCFECELDSVFGVEQIIIEFPELVS